MTKRKPAPPNGPRQLEFDFDRATKLRLLERLALDPPPDSWRTSAAMILATIRALDNYAGGCEAWRLRMATLAEYTGRSASAVKRALSAARRLNFVDVTRTGRANLFCLNWPAIRLAVAAGDQAAAANAPRTRRAMTTAWRKAARQLTDRGVGLAAAACDQAKARGLSPSDVLALVEHFDRINAATGGKAYGPAALYHRVRSALPNRPPADDWPPSRRKPAAPPNPAAAAADADQAAQRAADLAEQAELERQHGPTVDRLTPAEIVETLGHNQFLITLYRRGGLGPLIRDTLLTILDKTQTPQANP